MNGQAAALAPTAATPAVAVYRKLRRLIGAPDIEPLHKDQRQLTSPACTMASRTATRAFSLAGTIGRRTVSAHLPISDIAYLIGAGLVSTKRLTCSGASLS